MRSKRYNSAERSTVMPEGAERSRVLYLGNSFSLQPSCLPLIGGVEGDSKSSSSDTEVCPPNLLSFVETQAVLLSTLNREVFFDYGQALKDCKR